MIIDSGGRKSYSAIVDKNGRLLVHANSNDQILEASIHGDAYSIYTDMISLTTTASFSGMLYIRNTSTIPFFVEKIITQGTATAQWYLYKGVTTGTLVTSGVAKTPANLNLGVSLSFAGSALAGADARTITDGTIMAQLICATGNYDLDLNGSLMVSQNSTIALSCKPSVAGTFAAVVHGFFSADNQD